MELSISSEQISIRAGQHAMNGMLWLPEEYFGVVVCASCNGGKRLNPPNDYVASVLCNAHLGALWVDLLASGEGRSQNAPAELIKQRIEAACDWLQQHPPTAGIPIGLFGASEGAAAVQQVAAERGVGIAAVVVRGGQPAEPGVLASILAPTLLIVGGLDDTTVKVNRAAYAALRCKKKLEILPGATRAFDEPGIPEVVARLARAWFIQHAHLASA